MPDADAPPPTDSLPVTARWIYTILRDDGAHTPSELADRTRCGDRTVQRALRQLRQADLVECRTDPEDPRRTLYVPK